MTKVDWPTLIGKAVGDALAGIALGYFVFKGTGNFWLSIAAAFALGKLGSK